jgi:hypothetical protein
VTGILPLQMIDQLEKLDLDHFHLLERGRNTRNAMCIDRLSLSFYFSFSLPLSQASRHRTHTCTGGAGESRRSFLEDNSDHQGCYLATSPGFLFRIALLPAADLNPTLTTALIGPLIWVLGPRMQRMQRMSLLLSGLNNGKMEYYRKHASTVYIYACLL